MTVRSRVIVGLAGMVLLLQGATPVAFGQQRDPIDPLKLSVDYARFRADATSLYIEFYYSFSPRSLTYRTEDGGFKGGVDLTLLILLKDSVVFADRRLVSHELHDTTFSSASMNLVTVSAAQLSGGDYVARVIGRDMNDLTRADSLEMPVSVLPVGSERIVLSDIELATTVSGGAEGSQFYKNTLEVIPNPKGLFGEDQLCYFYAEVYNLLSSNDSSEYVVKWVVLDGARREVESREKIRKRNAESGVIVDRIIAGKLHTGTYTLGVSIVDTTGRVVSNSMKKFFVYNSRLGPDSTLVAKKTTSLSDLYSGMSEAELDAEFDQARYLQESQEVLQYKSLTEAEAKAAFLVNFWERRGNGLREEYLKRASFANEQFRVLGRQGYKTDRGRIYIIYGPASDYDRHPNEPEFRPYEVWTYEGIQGGVIFAFVQRVANGEYELVHSTHRNEIQDDQWLERYARNTR